MPPHVPGRASEKDNRLHGRDRTRPCSCETAAACASYNRCATLTGALPPGHSRRFSACTFARRNSSCPPTPDTALGANAILDVPMSWHVTMTPPDSTRRSPFWLGGVGGPMTHAGLCRARSHPPTGADSALPPAALASTRLAMPWGVDVTSDCSVRTSDGGIISRSSLRPKVLHNTYTRPCAGPIR